MLTGIDGKKIKYYRRMACIRTQQDLADILGCSLRTVKRWEMGKSIPRQEFLLKMKSLFKLSSLSALYKESKASDMVEHMQGVWQGYSTENMAKYGLKWSDIKRSIMNYPLLLSFTSSPSPQKVTGIATLFHFDHPDRKAYYPVLKLQGQFLTDESFELYYTNLTNHLHRGMIIFTFQNENTMTGSFCGLGVETGKHTAGDMRIKKINPTGNFSIQEKINTTFHKILFSQKSYKTRHGKSNDKVNHFFREFQEIFDYHKKSGNLDWQKPNPPNT